MSKLSDSERKSRTGVKGINSYGGCFEVVEYKSSRNSTVIFDNGFIKDNVHWGNILMGGVLSPYCKTCHGVGFVGEGIYSHKSHVSIYACWHAMIERCYNSKNKYAQRWYHDCTVCEEWHNFQNFAKWYDENFYELFSSQMNLDKDILIKGNKLYSPENCVFVSNSINMLFIKCELMRGDTPIGVYWHERDNEYRAQCSYIDLTTFKRKNKWLGGYDNQTDAFLAYKKFKESNIKGVAEYYKAHIPVKLYDAMCNYKVDETD